MDRNLLNTDEARSFLAAIVDSADAAIVGKDLAGNVVSWNAGAERMFGYAAAEMLGQPMTAVISPDRPDEEPRILNEALRGVVRNYETVRRRKDGTPIEVSLTVSPIRNQQGQIIGVSSIARDITIARRAERELRESRARLSGMIDSAMDAIISVDAEQCIVMFNAAAERMFRCTAAEVLGQPLDRLLPASFRQRHRRQVGEFGRTGVTSRAMGKSPALWGLRADGQEFPVEASISQVEVGGQKLYTAIVRDITESQKAQDEIQRMNLELEQRVEARTAELTSANQELEAFTYSVAHDLRAPLRHIDAFGKILEDEHAAALPEEARRFLQNMRAGTRRMSRLVDDLLKLARLGRQELRLQPASLGALVQEAQADLKSETAGRAVEWRLQPLPTVECDAGLLKQVFINLLSNAIKYTRSRSPAVIEVGTLDFNGRAAIFVRDNGVGFNMRYADKLFGVFQRLHTAQDFEGTGVGLATVDRIVRRHGGCVWAEAAVDKGAVFYFTLAGLGSATAPIPK
jgi:PAS domain S-box-containing protein